MKRIITIIAWSCLFLLLMPVALAKTIIYVPADNRPVSLEYAVDTVQAAGFTVLTPPAEMLAGRSFSGNPEKLWQWVTEHANEADALVLSVDSLVYGGLVDSRIHDDAEIVLEWRLKRFATLHAQHPSARVYAFSTLMRSPKLSAGGIEPPYYEKYGPDIFQITALQDKAELASLTADEQKKLRAAKAAVPQVYLNDWLNRRSKNLKINGKLITMTKESMFSYLVIGRDDTSPVSQSHKEARYLDTVAQGMPPNRYMSFPGADQLGMVMLARAYNELTGQSPVVEIQYAPGSGPAAIPSYEDQPTGKTIAEHIEAAGGRVKTGAQVPDLILMVNTPLLPFTEEAESFENVPVITDSTRQFVTDIGRQVAAGRQVAVADIAFANGSDNALMEELYKNNLLDKLSAYSGWNTASNTLGYAIGQGMLAKAMPQPERKRLLAIRYLDDWAYQANIRKQLYREVIYPQGGSLVYLNDLNPQLESAAEQQLRQFAAKRLWIDPEGIHASFPWNRMFELHVTVDNH